MHISAFEFRYSMSKLLQDKTIALTGAGKGIGRSCVDFFTTHGARVVALTRTGADVDSLKREFSGRPVEVMHGDVTRRADLVALRDLAIGRFGGIDGLVNNAGMRQRKDFLALDVSEFERVLRNNLTSCFESMQVFLPHMKDRGCGAIVNIASIVGVRGFEQLPGYAAAKAGLIGLSQAAAMEFASFGVRINVVVPAFVDTSYGDAFRQNQPDLYKWTIDRTPMKRWGRPEEVAACIAFLLSDLSSYVTGASYAVDGGWLAA